MRIEAIPEIVIQAVGGADTTILFIALGVVVLSSIMAIFFGIVAADKSSFILIPIGIFALVYGCAVLFSSINEVNSSHNAKVVEELQSVALEEQFGYKHVEVRPDGSFVASDDGLYISGTLVESGHNTYMVILDK